MVRPMQLRIASPCSADWDHMQGDERVRYCPECKLNVYNFAAMSTAEIEKTVENREGRLCARFYARADGTLLTQNCPVGFRAKVRRISRAAGAVLSTVMTAMSATFAAAQTGTGFAPSTQSQRSGTALLLEVTDQTGAVITRAKVSLIDRGKKILYEGVTDPKGQVLIPRLAPGTYAVVIAAVSFSINRLDVEVHGAQTQKVTAKMEISPEVTMGVVVSGSPFEAEPIRLPPVYLPRQSRLITPSP
jgi:hypothetical protein